MGHDVCTHPEGCGDKAINSSVVNTGGAMNCRTIQYNYEGDLKLPQSPKLIFADPPYNIGVAYEGDNTKDKLSPEQYQQFLINVMQRLAGQMDLGTTLWWVCPEEDADTVGPLLCKHIGPRLYRIIWHETFSQYNRFDLTRDYRFIFCHHLVDTDKSHIKPNFDSIRIPSKRMLMGDRRAVGPKIPGRVWKLRRLQGTAKDRVDWHPAQLPPELLDRILLGWSNATDLIVDAFAGSGSLGMRCIKHNRNFIGLEKSAVYTERMNERFNSL